MRNLFNVTTPDDEEIIGFTLGIFDGLHAGHVQLFETCLRYCDELFVGVLDDAWAKNNKRQPLFSLEERVEAIQEFCRADDRVGTITCSSLDVSEPMEQVDATHFFHGNDWLEQKDVFDKTLPDEVRKKLAKEGFTMILVPYFKPISSSELIKRVESRTKGGEK